MYVTLWVVEPSTADIETVLYPLVRIGDGMRRARGKVMDPTRQAVMQAAAIQGQVRPSELARELGVVQSSITRQVRALEDAGHVEVRADPDDRRSCLVSLTEEGWAEARRLTAIGIERFSQFVADWDAADVRMLGQLLSRLEASITEVRERQRPPEGRRWQQPVAEHG